MKLKALKARFSLLVSGMGRGMKKNTELGGGGLRVPE